MPKEIDCPKCNGLGGNMYKSVACKHCEGTGKITLYTDSDLQQVREEERERCAQECDRQGSEKEYAIGEAACSLCAEAIRQMEDK
jgi:RecJ-like exonuclease